MAKKLKLKPIPTDLLDRLKRLPALEVNGRMFATLEMPEGPPLILLELPPDQIPFSPELGYWAHLRPYQGVLVMLISALELSAGPGGWAIPSAYQPWNEFQALQKELGFDEGWEKSRPVAMLTITLSEGCRAALKYVVDSGALGITTTGVESIYPMQLQSWQVEELSACLKASDI